MARTQLELIEDAKAEGITLSEFLAYGSRMFLANARTNPDAGPLPTLDQIRQAFSA